MYPRHDGTYRANSLHILFPPSLVIEYTFRVARRQSMF